MSTEQRAPGAEPGEDQEWGENTRQALGEDAHHNQHSDADEMRRKWGLSTLTPENDPSTRGVYGNVIYHEQEPRNYKTPGGTNLFCVSGFGAGKSTLFRHLAIEVLSSNNDRGDGMQESVVWRGSQNRSEWIALRDWTTLWLPSNAEYDAYWSREDSNEEEQVELEDVVREVRYYDDPVDLNHSIEPGTFNVVYPDPTFQGCGDVVRESNRTEKHLPFISPEDVRSPLTDYTEPSPPVHWWFAWYLARIDQGPYNVYITLEFDEVSEWCPHDASKDDHMTWKKVDVLSDAILDARKFGLSTFLAGQNSRHVHEMLRRVFQNRVVLGGNSNPTSRSQVIGFDAMPMNMEFMTTRDIGQGLIFRESGFDEFTWANIDKKRVDKGRKLKVEVFHDYV